MVGVTFVHQELHHLAVYQRVGLLVPRNDRIGNLAVIWLSNLDFDMLVAHDYVVLLNLLRVLDNHDLLSLHLPVVRMVW